MDQVRKLSSDDNNKKQSIIYKTSQTNLRVCDIHTAAVCVDFLGATEKCELICNMSAGSQLHGDLAGSHVNSKQGKKDKKSMAPARPILNQITLLVTVACLFVPILTLNNQFEKGHKYNELAVKTIMVLNAGSK